MDSENNEENKQNQENSQPHETSDNKINTSISTDNSSKINLEPNSNLKPENSESKENLDLDKSNTNKKEKEKEKIEQINDNNKEEQLNIKSNKDKNEEFLKDMELIKEIKNENYKRFYIKKNFCDFRTREDKEWKMGIIKEILDDSILINDNIKNKEPKQIKIDNSSLLSYFRNYSKPLEENIYNKRENKESLNDRLNFLEKLIKGDDLFNSDNVWDIYYYLHSKIFFGLDAAMKINYSYNYRYNYSFSRDDNEGFEESFKIILCILLFISKYYKYILDNKDEFIYYQNNIRNTDLKDLKIIKKKYAFFSFFEESINLLNKIFANSADYLSWFQCFESDFKEFLPSIIDKEVNLNLNICPLYEGQTLEEEKDNNEKGEGNNESQNEENKNKLILKRICVKQAYKFVTTYTTENIKIKAFIVAYFIDYFNALNGFSYLFQICYCSQSITLDFLYEVLGSFNYGKSLTGYYRNFTEEKKKLLKFIYTYFDNLNEKTIVEYKTEKILSLIQKISSLTNTEEEDEQKIMENLFFNYIAKTLLLSKKFEQKISSLNIINDILKTIKNGSSIYNYNIKIKIERMSFEDFCVNCKRNKLLKNLLNDQSIHEEIIKKLPEIIYVMYKFNFGYLNEEDEEKIKSEKKMIFDVLFNKLLESEQNNEKLVKNIQNIISDFCVILSEEDKLYVYGEIKNYIEKSIKKKGIPVKDHLLFIIDYSLRAVATKNENKKDKKNKKEKENIENKEENLKEKKIEEETKREIKEKENKEENLKEKKIEEETKKEIKEKENKEENNENKNEETLDLKMEEKDYYGLIFLLDYLSEEQYINYNMTNEQKIELINTSIDGIIKIIDNCEKQDLIIKNLLIKANNAINISKDTIQFLLLFEKIKNNKNINNLFNNIFEEYSKKNGILSSLMLNMNRYLCIVNDKNTKEKEKESVENDGKKVYEGLFDNELNINLRVKLIFLLLHNNLNEENLNNLNKLIIRSCEKNSFANDCINKFIYKNLTKLDLKFIQYFYDNVLLSEEKLSNVNDLQYYKLCNLIIKEINKINKIFYFMNGKDLAVINCESEKEIKGIDLLWNFLINTESKEIRNDITDFLADIFIGIRIGNKEKTEKYWKNFVKSIYDKLDEILKKEKENTNNNTNSSEQAIHGIISLIKKIENKFANKGEIINNINKIIEEISLNKSEKNNQKEKEETNEEESEEENEENDNEENNQNNKKENNELIKKIYFSGKKYNTDETLNFDTKIDSTEYFYMFRYKLSSFFKIPVNLVKVVIDENKDKKMPDELKNIEFNLYNDFDNTYSLINEIEQKIKKNENDEIKLKLKVEIIRDNEQLKNIKNLIKDFPKLIKLLKRKNSEYLLDVWCLIKEDSNKKNPNIIQIIKEILKEENLEKLNSIFNFEDTNIYYISYILFHLYNVIDEFKSDDKYINEIFLKSNIWKEKIQNIRLENSEKPHLGEIYEKNNVIKYILNIFKIISLKTRDINVLLFILNKLIEYYYETIKECISINLKNLPPTDGIQVDLIEDLYIEISSEIKDIIIKNKIIFDNFIKFLLNQNTSEENNNKIKYQFEFLFSEGIIKNRIFSLNQKLQSFLIIIEDDNFFTQEGNAQNKIINDFYLYLLNLFFNKKTHEKIMNCIKNIALDNSEDIRFNKEKYENNIKLYFDIIINIIDKVYPVVGNKFNFKNYINEISLQTIYNPIIDEIPLDLSYHEIILGGHCSILINLLSKMDNYKELLDFKVNDEKKLKQYLFDEIIMNKCNNNIFTEKNIDNYKSLSITTSYAFKQAINLFIFLLMQNIQNENSLEIKYFFDKLKELHKLCYWKGDNMLDWKLDYKDNSRLAPFVGLKNLGCTCYMNSLLQVFFNFVPFRESLLKCKCKYEKKNSLYQIKKLFYSLKYLQVNYYTPSDFPDNFDDEELNVHLQMDVDEFFGIILDKIENRLKGTKNENLVKYFFQGRQNDNLIFQEGCSHNRTNENKFYSIQLQVQNKKNIYESLDILTDGELMNGDNSIFCPDCNNKFPAVKSQNFKTLPRMLLFVLKRFEYDYEENRKVKINDKYEFPYELDMTKYISEKKKDPDLNKYVLKSVVVHMGNCEGGHYYAFIKNEDGQWYEFNDTQVTPSNFESLKEEAFGGEEIIYNNGNKKTSQKNRSAYLLFYEKKIQTDCEKFDNIEAINIFYGLNNNNENKKDDNIKNENNNNEEISENKINIYNEENKEGDLNKDENENKDENGMKDILENINEEMFKYFLNKKLFSNEYQYFILELYINVLNYFYSFDLPVFFKHLCRNSNDKAVLREINGINSNLNSYIDKKKLILFKPKIFSKNRANTNSEQILNIFKTFILYFYNVLLRTKEKEYLGGMVDLMKFFVNDQTDCANYLIEEFCNINVIIEYLMNCPLYEIKKLVVGILYCAMIKSVNEYELNIIKEGNGKKKSSHKSNSKKAEILQSTKDDENLARQLQEGNVNGNYVFDNPLEYKNIPKNLLKMIYNILHIIRDKGYSHMNEYRFLYFVIYRFSLINENTREFLINKCRVFELLCLLLHKNCATYNYDIKEIIDSTYVGPFTVSHDILNSKGKKDGNAIIDKGGMYHIENYIYMLFFYLLSYTTKKPLIKEDSGYSLQNKDFVRVLLNNIRTKQDAFSFSNFINEKCKNNKSRINSVMEVLMEYLGKIDNNDKINYDFNNYNNFVDNNMNENPDDNDPGMNPKYLLIIIKRFILSLKSEFIIKGLKNIFKIFFSNEKYYNFCIMIIDFLIELFCFYLKGLISSFKKDLEQIILWLKKNPISPTLFEIDGIFLYKYVKVNYENNISNDKINEFTQKETENTQNKILRLKSIIRNEFNKIEMKCEEDIDLSDFKFIIGDVILYKGKEVVIEEALDELLKITLEINKKDGKKKAAIIDRKEIWIETDNPKIEIKELKGK